VKIATFNINGVNGRLDNLIDWLDAAAPDVVCLQETRTPDVRFPRAALERAGYGAVWRGEGGFNGVAILARDATPVLTREALPGATDGQPRYIEAAVGGVLIGCLYAPNGNPQPGPKFDYKLNWFAHLLAHAQALLDEGVPVALAGDYNVVPEPRDIYVTASYDTNALVQPAPRAAFAKLVAQGWTDALRAMHPDVGDLYTFWDYKRRRWPRNAGLRLDHLLLSPDLAPRLAAAGVDRAARGRDNASDHAPVWITLGAAKKRTRRR